MPDHYRILQSYTSVMVCVMYIAHERSLVMTEPNSDVVFGKYPCTAHAYRTSHFGIESRARSRRGRVGSRSLQLAAKNITGCQWNFRRRRVFFFLT